MGRLQGKIALVTGGSRGIGAAVSRHLAAEGAAVAVNYRQGREQAEAVVKDIEAAGGRAMAWQADVRRQVEVKAMVAAISKRWGEIDVLVCSAGIVRDGLGIGMPKEDWDEVIEVNLTGSFVAIREVLAEMVSRRSGSIVCISSVHAEAGGQGHCNYAASKAGLLALVRALALEVAPRGVRVNAVSPGLIVTEMTAEVRESAGLELQRGIPMRRFGEAVEVAQAVTFLASAEASYVTGINLVVSGGMGL